jgi:hypothetical protein
MGRLGKAAKAVTEARNRLAAAQENLATAKDPVAAQTELARAEKRLTETSGRLQRSVGRAAGRAGALDVSTRHLERIEARVGKSTEAPRQRMDQPFDAKNRRPDLSDITNVPPGSKADRHGGVVNDRNARVFVQHEEVRSDLRAQHDAIVNAARKDRSTAKALGHVYERLLVDDLTPGSGKGLRMYSDAGDKTRVSDHGVHEFTLEGDAGKLSSGKLDQIWRDLLAVTPGASKPRNEAIVTVPTLSPASERQLVKMAHAYEQLTGHRPTIIVRETVRP